MCFECPYRQREREINVVVEELHGCTPPPKLGCA